MSNSAMEKEQQVRTANTKMREGKSDGGRAAGHRLGGFSALFLSCSLFSFVIFPSSINYGSSHRREHGTLANSQQTDTGNFITWGPEIVPLYHFQTSKQDQCPLTVKFSMTRGLERISASSRLYASETDFQPLYSPWCFLLMIFLIN